jgi:hypothetical protein
MKTIKFKITGQVTEAYVHSGKISLIQGNTVENSILHHIKEKGEFSPEALEKELLPILPQLVGKRLLQKFASEGKLIENGNSFKSPANRKPEEGHLPLPEHSILKVLVYKAGENTIVFGAALENDRKRPRQDETIKIQGSFSLPLAGRIGYSVFVEGVNVFQEKGIDDGTELIIDSRSARLVWQNQVIKDFGLVHFKDLIPAQLDMDRNEARIIVQTPTDDSFLVPYSIDTLEVKGMKLKLAQILRLKKVPLNESSAVNAILALVRQKKPNAESYREVVNDVWIKEAESWGFEKAALFPEGFPNYANFHSSLNEN